MKVGKAIYNILSQSTDVQSNFPFNTTDYAPTGTELVTNGDFSDGVEKIVDGDFPLPNNNWTLNSGWTIPVGGSADWATLGSNNPITQSLTFATDKSYKVTFTIANVVGTPVRILIRNQGDVNQDITASWEDFDDGTFTYYFVSSSNNTSINIYGRNDVGDSFSLSNVSVKELGEGWTVQTGWSIGEDKAICDGSTNNAIYQAITLPIGNLKITFKVEDFTSGTLKLWINLPAFTTIVTATAADTYEAYITTTSGANNIYFYSVAFVGSITNVSVQEMILTKIFPELAPPDIDAPYIVYSVVSNSPSDTKNANGDIDTANIEVYGFQDTYNKAVDLGVSVRAALDRKTGTYNTIEIQSTNYVNEQMDVNEARKLWAAIQDYSIRIKNI